MTHEEWLQQFRDELVKLRPHLTLKPRYAIAQYDPTQHPRDLARQYHKQQEPPAPPPKKPHR